MKTALVLHPKPPFSFLDTANSHGWSQLAPNSWVEGQNIFTRVELLGSGMVTLWEISGSLDTESPTIQVTVNHNRELSEADEDETRAKISAMFRLDENLNEFYTLCREHDGLWLKALEGRGRLLASPTVFEDVVRTIATTNVQWGGTRSMLKRLAENFGEPYPENPALKSFPQPYSIAAFSFDEFAGKARMGYRSEYVHVLASRISSGEIDLESLRGSELSTPYLRKELLSLKGVGAYAAATLLTLLGRYDELPIDTVFRTFIAKKYFSDEYPGDKAATAIYESWGKWKYLAYWFEIWDYYTTKTVD